MSTLPRPLALLMLWLAVAAAVAAADGSGEARSNRSSSAVQRSAPPTLPAPEAPTVVRVDPERGLGSPNAPLALVEFADFACPYCRRFHEEMLPRLKAAFIDSGRLRYFYKDFPLAQHAHAFGAAVAARCAALQGRYWDMVDALYAQQARLGRDFYRAAAARLALDAGAFDRCLGARPVQQAVQHDVAEGRRLGVRATPTFVLGRLEGDRVRVERTAAGIPTFETFAEEIDLLGP